MEHDLYICTGKYHLFCVLLLKMIDNVHRAGDLLICDCFEGAQSIYESLAAYCKTEKKIFDNLVFLPKSQYDELDPTVSMAYSKRIMRVIHNKISRPINRIDKYINNRYNRIYIAGAVPSLIEYCLYSHYKYNSEINLFDDGLGSRIQWKGPSLRRKLTDYYRLSEFWNSLNHKFFFSPELVCNTFPFIPIVEQCKPIENEICKRGLSWSSVLHTLNNVYEYSADNDPFQKNNVIYFSAGFDLYNWLKKYSKTECELVNYIGKQYNRFIVKRHPNSNETYDPQIQSTNVSFIPEIFFLNADIENKLLISSGSATVFNPAFIFNKNPFVILTYKLFGENEDLQKDLFRCSGSELENKINKTLISGYRDKSKIYIPRTLHELDEAIKDYLLRTDNNK